RPPHPSPGYRALSLNAMQIRLCVAPCLRQGATHINRLPFSHKKYFSFIRLSSPSAIAVTHKPYGHTLFAHPVIKHLTLCNKNVHIQYSKSF
ncbi:MAG: hypothetical protein NZM35_00005, partial [Chitinophagales bacterium]|nr:hypothetical protein [Chitinophagales bacterium]